MPETLNPVILDMAKWAISTRRTKNAFVPPPEMTGGAAGGGMPPGGAPPGGAPPMDPAAMGGGAPPMDPAAAGGGAMMPPPSESLAPPQAPITPESIAQIVTQAVQAAGAGGKGGKGGKADPNMMAQDVFQTKRLLLHLYSSMGLSIPPDVLEDPNRDPMTGMPGVGLGANAAAAPPVSNPPGSAATLAPPGAAPAPPAGGAEKSSSVETVGYPTSYKFPDQFSTDSRAGAAALIARRVAKQRAGL